MRKNLMLGIAIYTCESVFGALVPHNGLGVISRSEDYSAARIAGVAQDNSVAVEEDASNSCIDVRKIDVIHRPDLEKGTAKIRVRELSSEGVENQFFVDLPLIRTIRGYQHDFVNGYSYPIEEISTEISNIEKADVTGRLIINSNFVNTHQKFPHQERDTGLYKMDDTQLKGYPYKEISIDIDGTKQVIDARRLGKEAIDYISTGEKQQRILAPAANGAEYQAVDVEEEYKRPDGTSFKQKRTQQYRIGSRLVDYDHDFYKGVSHAKKERYVQIDGQELSIDILTDYSRQYRHIKRITGYTNDDNLLRAAPNTALYISTPTGDQLIDQSRHRGGYEKYEHLQTGPVYRTGETWSDNNYNYYKTNQESAYQRPDQSIFIQSEPGVEKVMKPRPPAPVPPAQPVVVHQQQRGGGVSNEFERAGHAVRKLFRL